jgi:hypothetical protein
MEQHTTKRKSGRGKDIAALFACCRPHRHLCTFLSELKIADFYCGFKKM